MEPKPSLLRPAEETQWCSLVIFPPTGGEHSLEETPGLAFVPSIPLKSLFDIMLGSHRVEILPLCRDRHLSSSPLEMVAQSLTISPGC